MKFFKVLKEKIVHIILEEYIEDNVYKKKLLKGLIYIKLDFVTSIATYRLFGIKILDRSFELGYSKLKLFGIIKINKSKKETINFLLPILRLYLKKYIDQIKYEVLPLYSRIGETYLTLACIKSFIKQNRIKYPIFISCYSHLKDLFKLFSLDIPYIVVPYVFRELHFADIKNTQFNDLVYYQLLSFEHFVELEKSLQQNKTCKFKKELKKRLNINCPEEDVTFLDSTIKKSSKKMNFIGLKEPFAYIVPDAQSNKSCSNEFWENLALELHDLGYDVFFNSIPYNIKNSAYKTCHLSLDEAKYVAKKASLIIGIRCGLLDVLLNNKSKIFCVYKEFKNRNKYFPCLGVKKIMSAFTLKQLPEANVDNIYEYDAENNEEQFILSDICEKIEGFQIASNK